MKKKKNKIDIEQGLIDLLENRIHSLEIERNLYEQNPTLMKNLKIMNVELIQNDITALKKALRKKI